MGQPQRCSYWQVLSAQNINKDMSNRMLFAAGSHRACDAGIQFGELG